jgi:hypothetical protein
MNRFVVHKHTQEGQTHWDLMLEWGDKLKTWRLENPPEKLAAQKNKAIPIFDHDKKFLTYQGPVNNGKGTVEIVDEGKLKITSEKDGIMGIMELDIQGKILNGNFTLVRTQNNDWELTKICRKPLTMVTKKELNNETDKSKECNSCYKKIDSRATVCNYCGQGQKWLRKYFGEISIVTSIISLVISVILMVFAGINLLQAYQKNVDASEALNTANKAVEQIQNIAYITAKADLTKLATGISGFTDGIPMKTKLYLHDQIITSLRELRIPEASIIDADKIWAKGIGIVYCIAIQSTFEGSVYVGKVNMKASPELRKASGEFGKMYKMELSEQDTNPSPEEIQSFIEEKGFMNNATRELISDYRHYLDTGNIRRQEILEKLFTYQE